MPTGIRKTFTSFLSLRCSACKEIKEDDEFPRRRELKRGRDYACKDCHKARWKANSHPRDKQKMSAWRQQNKERISEQHRTRRLRHYGITSLEHAELLNSQQGVCAICGKPPSDRWNTLHVDHDHETGRVRGLLCHHCNVGLGNFMDDPALLEKAIKYLSRMT